MSGEKSTVTQLKEKAKKIRKDVLEMCVKAATGHVTSSMSCIDMLVALYFGGILRYDPKSPSDPCRDRFILSKGQASPALYAVLAEAGYFDPSELKKFAQYGGKFGVHLQKDVPGAEITCGSLGHGFGIAAGIALAAKMNRELHMVFTMLGDGECYEGSIWEMAAFVGHNQLNNLVAIVDRNFLCVTDFTENLVRLEPFEDKWKAFGWEVKRIDGHSFEEIRGTLENVRSRRSSKPLAVIADTVKGRGIDNMCYNPLWHGLAPKDEEAKKAKLCLERSWDNE